MSLEILDGNNVRLSVAGPVTVNAGGSGYKHLQSTASSSWVVNHNLGKAVTFQVFGNAGNLVACDSIELSNNTVRFDFATPHAGYANIS
jgi:hypothetical protein